MGPEKQQAAERCEGRMTAIETPARAMRPHLRHDGKTVATPERSGRPALASAPWADAAHRGGMPPYRVSASQLEAGWPRTQRIRQQDMAGPTRRVTNDVRFMARTIRAGRVTINSGRRPPRRISATRLANPVSGTCEGHAAGPCPVSLHRRASHTPGHPQYSPEIRIRHPRRRRGILGDRPPGTPRQTPAKETQ